MKLLTADFITSSDCLKNCPEFNLPEIALIGRSNVGKSSFINTLVNRKNLARTSNTPGKTRLINFYKLNDQLIIVDLPGYGYAKISQTEQQKWKNNLEEYLLQRKSLKTVVQLIDARHEVQNNDLLMRKWLDYNNISVITVATKVDCVSKNEANKSVQAITKTLNSQVIQFSAKSGIGKDKILKLFDQIIK